MTDHNETDAFVLNVYLSTRIVTDPPNVPPGTYVECIAKSGEWVMYHELLGPVEGNVAAIELRDDVTGVFSGCILGISDNFKRWKL